MRSISEIKRDNEQLTVFNDLTKVVMTQCKDGTWSVTRTRNNNSETAHGLKDLDDAISYVTALKVHVKEFYNEGSV